MLFMRGPNKHLSFVVERRNSDSLEKAISLAFAEEQELIFLQEMFKVQCKIYKRSNHSTNNYCRYRYQSDSGVRHFQNQNRNQNPQKQNRNIILINIQGDFKFKPKSKS